eukprot:3788075-Prymnesium_polylepis.1
MPLPVPQSLLASNGASPPSRAGGRHAGGGRALGRRDPRQQGSARHGGQREARRRVGRQVSAPHTPSPLSPQPSALSLAPSLTLAVVSAVKRARRPFTPSPTTLAPNY